MNMQKKIPPPKFKNGTKSTTIGWNYEENEDAKMWKENVQCISHPSFFSRLTLLGFFRQRGPQTPSSCPPKWGGCILCIFCLFFEVGHFPCCLYKFCSTQFFWRQGNGPYQKTMAQPKAWLMRTFWGGGVSCYANEPMQKIIYPEEAKKSPGREIFLSTWTWFHHCQWK